MVDISQKKINTTQIQVPIKAFLKNVYTTQKQVPIKAFLIAIGITSFIGYSTYHDLFPPPMITTKTDTQMIHIQMMQEFGDCNQKLITYIPVLKTL